MPQNDNVDMNNDERKIDRSIGHRIALLAAEEKNKKLFMSKSLSSMEKDDLAFLVKSLAEITLDKNNESVFNHIPENPCQTVKPYLDNHVEFFLRLILMTERQDRLELDCGRLTRHLNVCYKCFQIFCNTMRDYYNTIHKLTDEMK